MFAAVVGLRLWVVYWCVPQVTGRRLWAWWPRLSCCLHVSLHTSVWVWAASFLDGWEFWTTVISVQCYLLLMFCWRHVHCTSSYVFIGHSPTHCLSFTYCSVCWLVIQFTDAMLLSVSCAFSSIHRTWYHPSLIANPLTLYLGDQQASSVRSFLLSCHMLIT